MLQPWYQILHELWFGNKVLSFIFLYLFYSDSAKLYVLHASLSLSASAMTNQPPVTHMRTHTHNTDRDTHSISRKVLTAAESIEIDTFTVKSQLVDPLNNAVKCPEAITEHLLLNQTLVSFRAETPKQIPALCEKAQFIKAERLFYCPLCVCCQSKLYIECLDFV